MENLSKWLILSLLLVQGLAAQTTETLLIGPGDTIHVQVFDSPELEEHARVMDSGDLPLLLGGSVNVAGMTPAQAARAIEDVLLHRNILLNPRVLVSIEQTTTHNVSILGEVRSPGAYPIGTPRSILDVLALAGGLTDSADRKVLIQRHGTSVRVPYFVSNVSSAALDTAVIINPGDTILIPKAGIVYALGDLARPGGYTMTNNDAKVSVLELVARAGGTPPSAYPSRSVLLRKSGDGYVRIHLPLSNMQKGKVADIPMQPDDIVYVPFSYLRNSVVNASGIAASVGSAAVYHF
jgi:polysaccharide export outer membrane protein